MLTSATTGSRPIRRVATALAAVVVLATALAGCINLPGDTSQIELVSTTSSGGWTYDVYRNLAYPCAIEGYQTFVVATRTGAEPAGTHPLWVKVHGGGVGYFDSTGRPIPAGNKREEPGSTLINRFDDGLTADVFAQPEGFRGLAVSMCSHDLYAGTGQEDPNNPNTLPDGSPRTTNGLLATKAAIQFVLDRYPTDDYFLHGGSAGSAGTLHLAWGLQQQKIPPAGIVADSGVLNLLYEQAQIDQSLPCARSPEMAATVPQRMDPDVVDPANQPHLLVADGRLTVPVLHIWNRGDPNVCGATPMTCTRADGSTTTLGSADCAHEPLRAAIAAQGPSSRSANLRVCVDDPSRVGACDKHVVTTSGTLVNTEPGVPADYDAVALAWVEARRADD